MEVKMKKAFSILIVSFLLGVFGFSNYYPEDQYAKGLIIINPQDEKTFMADSLINRLQT